MSWSPPCSPSSPGSKFRPKKEEAPQRWQKAFSDNTSAGLQAAVAAHEHCTSVCYCFLCLVWSLAAQGRLQSHVSAMYKLTFLTKSCSVHALAWQLFYRCKCSLLCLLLPKPWPPLTLPGDTPGLKWHQMKWKCSDFEADSRGALLSHAMRQQNGALWAPTLLNWTENVRVWCPAGNSELMQLHGTAPALPRSQKCSPAQLLHPNVVFLLRLSPHCSN